MQMQIEQEGRVYDNKCGNFWFGNYDWYMELLGIHTLEYKMFVVIEVDFNNSRESSHRWLKCLPRGHHRIFYLTAWVSHQSKSEDVLIEK